jgi:hypothetical protein
MPYDGQRRSIALTDHGNGAKIFLPGLTAWNPFIAATFKGNALVLETFGPIACNWQAFVGHRLQEDVALMKRLSQCRTANGVVSAYLDFWEIAGEDYGKECASLTKLVPAAASKMISAVQTATQQGDAEPFAMRQAA